MSASNIEPEQPEMVAEAPTSSKIQQQQPRKLTALERNNLEWESHKDEIRDIYMVEDKTLKETIERKWKEKMKEWEFDKNVPGKEMAFMARKALKREAEEGKDTIFHRNEVLVDGSKVESFKKQKLNMDDCEGRLMPATPPHISYKTPKSNSTYESPPASLKHGSDLLTAEVDNLVQTSDERPGSVDNSISANIGGQNPELFGFMAQLELSPENHGLGDFQPLEISDSRKQIMSPDMSSSPDSDVSIDSSVDGQYTSSEDGGQPPAEQTADMGGFFDVVAAVYQLQEDIQVARHFMENGARDRAVSTYAKAICGYFHKSGRQSNSLITTCLAALVECFNSCKRDEVPASARVCLELIQKSWTFRWEPSIRSLLSSAFETLLRTHMGISQSYTMHGLTAALNDQNLSEPLHSSLDAVLEQKPDEPLTPGKRKIQQLRINLIAFACSLKAYLGEPSSSMVEMSDLRQTIYKLCDDLRSFDGADYYYSYYSSIQPTTTQLAATCSNTGWLDEAELLFRVLRCNQSVNLIPNRRRIQIFNRYCRHLEKRKWYTELLSVLHSAYICFEDSYISEVVTSELQQDVLSTRNILSNVPRPLSQYISQEEEFEIVKLDKLLSTAIQIPIGSGIEEREDDRDAHGMGEERDESEDEDDGEQEDDLRSSNKFGVTYTESLMTGISFNYSDLYR